MPEVQSLENLVWAHQTLMRLIELVQMNGLIGERMNVALVAMGQAAVDLESLIAELSQNVRRRKTD